MVDVSRRAYERNGIKAIVDNDEILWLNERHIEEGLDHKKFWEIAKITIKYHSDHRKHIYELVEKHKVTSK